MITCRNRKIFDRESWQEFTNVTPHGLAAKMLWAQPFGFSREDVAAVKSAAGWAENEGDDDVAYWARSVAARIEALLPQETTPRAATEGGA